MKPRREHLTFVVLAATLLAATSIPAGAKAPKPPKPPKPTVKLLTVNEQAAVDKRAIKIRVEAKHGAEAKASGDVIVDGYPEDFPFELAQVTKPLKNKQATISFPLSARKVELISFAADTCRSTSITVRAEVKKRVRTVSGNLAVPSDC